MKDGGVWNQCDALLLPLGYPKEPSMIPKTPQNDKARRRDSGWPSDEEWFAAEAQSPDDLDEDPDKQEPPTTTTPARKGK